MGLIISYVTLIDALSSFITGAPNANEAIRIIISCDRYVATIEQEKD